MAGAINPDESNVTRLYAAFTQMRDSSEYQGKTKHSQNVLRTLELIITSLNSNRSVHGIVQFSDELMATLQSIASLLKITDHGKHSLSSISTRKCSMWKRFNDFCTSTKYREDWLSLLRMLGIEDKVPIAVIANHLARVLLDDMIIQMIPHKEKEIDDAVIELSTDEEEAIRYTCGYVVRTLKKKLAKQTHYIEILDAMHPDNEDDDDSDDFLTYTTNWIARVDRGGLYKVNDETFLLIRWMELTMRKCMCGKSIDICLAISNILSSENVLSCWNLICHNLTDDKSDILLTKIAELWVTIRGFSYAGNLIEQYKQITKSKFGKKSLRKSLRLENEKKLT